MAGRRLVSCDSHWTFHNCTLFAWPISKSVQGINVKNEPQRESINCSHSHAGGPRLLFEQKTDSNNSNKRDSRQLSKNYPPEYELREQLINAGRDTALARVAELETREMFTKEASIERFCSRALQDACAKLGEQGLQEMRKNHMLELENDNLKKLMQVYQDDSTENMAKVTVEQKINARLSDRTTDLALAQIMVNQMRRLEVDHHGLFSIHINPSTWAGPTANTYNSLNLKYGSIGTFSGPSNSSNLPSNVIQHILSAVPNIDPNAQDNNVRGKAVSKPNIWSANKYEESDTESKLEDEV
ncbi:hypothetical protein P154DRAFT_609516 [Amniculicola lignicola CBS 123094]|uniref:Uncharacterized protein n=1 Tax=Amniculicola lignicola CBS 123094 TaxID=1392246 RepID=A0A6A5W4K7_9PLEO|nr:hypothetical protein P154DRAFT_609516 [Amniculicola lignicola CBS 123094]